MDSAEQYLDMLFGDAEGYVAVASKGDTWEEKQFSWPSGRGRLLRWVERRIDDCNIFICPSLRSERRRIKGDGVNLRWLWADIDWEKVTDKPAVVKALKKLLPARVLSGTGKNLHVYLEIDRAVTVEEHYRLNQGLRDLLQADAKHPDNSLLRLPGTYNRKGRPVEVTWARDKSDLWTPANLLRIPAIRDTVVTGGNGKVGDGTYEQVDVSDVPAQARRWANMGVDQAIDVYGSRHGAVFQVTQRLIKLGLDRDEIHTLLEQFEAGVEKQDDEHGYDMHRDIDRCIARYPTLDQVLPDEDDTAFTDLTPEEVAEEEDNDFQKAAEKLVRNWDIQSRARQIQAHRSFLPPPDGLTAYFKDQLAEPEREVRYLVEGLASVGDNITITGQYKTGKTLFVCNLIRSLVENQDFLDQFAVDDLKDCTVGLWSCEMTQDVLVNRYLRPQEFTDAGASSLIIWHGRGFGINLMDDVGKQWAINWLRNEDVSVWIIDSFARICAMAGVDENANDEVLKLLKTLDEIKHAAGVSELFLISHTGRGELAKERARGATVFDDWADARWVITRDGDVRFLRVEGRDVELTTRSLEYDADTKRITLGGDKRTATQDFGVRTVTDIVGANPGITKTSLGAKIKERKVPGYSQNPGVAALINETEELGFIKGDNGKGRRVCYYVVPDGVPAGGGASIRELDFSKVKAHQSKVRS
jgi:hypothetical protein